MSAHSDDNDVSGYPATPNPLTYRMVQLRVEARELDRVIGQLEQRAAAKEAAARLSAAAAGGLQDQADAERKLRDQYAAERADRLLRSAESAAASSRRSATIASDCRAAVEDVRRTQRGYLEIANRVDRAGAGAAAMLPADRIETEIRQASAGLHGALAAAKPHRATLPTGIPTGPLPHLAALTDRINHELRARGGTGRFTPEALEQTLRAHFREVMSADGLVLTDGDGAEVDAGALAQAWIRLQPGELHEILNPEVGSSEQIHGGFQRGGRAVSGAVASSTSTTGEVGLQTVAAALPEGSPLRTAASVASAGISVTRGRSRVLTSNATTFAFSGGVVDNRGEQQLFQSAALWEVASRRGVAGPWRSAQPVARGSSGDAGALRIWMPAGLSAPPPRNVTGIGAYGEQPDPELPDHAIIAMTGLNSLTDLVAERLSSELGGLDQVGYDQLRGIVGSDLPTRLRETASAGGRGWQLYRNGKPAAYLHIQTVVDRAQVSAYGEPSTEDWLERGLRIGSSGAGGAQQFGSDATVLARGGPGGIDAGSTGAAIGPNAHAGSATSRTDGVSIERRLWDPSVQRYTGPTQAYGVAMEHRITIVPLNGRPPVQVSGSTEALLRMAEHDAFRYGLPVDTAAINRTPTGEVVRNADGRIMLRGDPRPTSEPLRLPPWLGDGPQQMRGAGPGEVRNLTGADPARWQLLQLLAERGFVPQLNRDGTPRTDRPVAADQLANLELLRQQLSAFNLETGYDQACQEGIPLTLVRHRTGLPPQRATFRISLRQHVSQATTDAVTDYQPGVRLSVGSDSTTRVTGRERRYPWGGGFGVQEANPGAHAARDVGFSHRRAARSRSYDVSSMRMTNLAPLNEHPDPTVQFTVPHDLIVTEETVRGASTPLVAVPGRANVFLAKGFCSRPGTGLTRPSSGLVDPEVLEHAQLLHQDGRNLLTNLHAVLPAGTRFDSASLHHLAAFLNPRSMVAHPEWMANEYRTRLAVSPGASRPRDVGDSVLPKQASLAVRGGISGLAFAGAKEMVAGDIELTFNRLGVTAGRSRPRTTEGSFDAGAATGAAARSGTTSQSTTRADVTGMERLRIILGQHYLFVADAAFDAEVSTDAGTPALRHQLPAGKVLLSIPEREALQHYGRGLLDLPLAQVADAAERLSTGKLQLDRRTATAMIARYSQDRQHRPQAAATGLAASHTDDRLAELTRSATGLPSPAAGTSPGLAATLNDATQLSTLRHQHPMPEQYRRTMAAAMIERSTFVDQSGHRSDPLSAVRQAIDRLDPNLLAADPVLGDSLAGTLAGKRWRSHLDDMLDPNGLQTTFPVAPAGRSARRRGRRSRKKPMALRLRMVARFDGPPMVDGNPDGTPHTPGTNRLGMIQRYHSTAESRRSAAASSVTGQGGGQAEYDGFDGDIGEGTLQGATSRDLQTAATSSSQRTKLQRLAYRDTARVERGLHFAVEAELVAAGSAVTRARRVRGRHRLERGRKHRGRHRLERGRHRLERGRHRRGRHRQGGSQADPVRTSRVEMYARLDMLVPTAHIGNRREPKRVRDHRAVSLPRVTVEGSVPYIPGDEPERNSLFDALTEGLSSSKLLTRRGVALYRDELATRTSANARNAAFGAITGSGGYELVPGLPVPGHKDKQVHVYARATVGGVELLTEPVPGTEKGEADRIEKTTTTSTAQARLLPGSGTLKQEAGAGVNASSTVGLRVNETVTDTSGKENQTTMLEQGDVVSVRLRLDYHLDYERRNARTNKVEHRETRANAARSEAYVTMFAAEYREMIDKMESGQAVGRVADPLRATGIPHDVLVARQTQPRFPARGPNQPPNGIDTGHGPTSTAYTSRGGSDGIGIP